MIETALRAIAAFLLFTSAVPANALTGDEEAACGAILCLAGGAGEPACVPYLDRYFSITHRDWDRQFELRLDFLELCPTDELPPEVRPMLARYGELCQPDELLLYLNSQLCGGYEMDETGSCPDPSPDAWRVCASFYGHEYTIYEPPKLVQRCDRGSDYDGAWSLSCSYEWVPASYVVGSGCQATRPVGAFGCTESLVN
jgi:hypothetical protein